MMYVSSACVKHQYIKDSVEELAKNGFEHIELSGGTQYYEGFEDDLLLLKDKYGLNFILHNYFPPPQEDFMLNLASLNEDVFQKTMEHYKKAILLSSKLGSKRFGLHAGLFVDITIKEIGAKILNRPLYDTNKALERFCQGFKALEKVSQDVDLYIENNVLSKSNFKIFEGQRPFMLMDAQGYEELRSKMTFNLLLDVAHLHVSAMSLGLDFSDQLQKLMPVANYVHVSDNDGLHDQGLCFTEKSTLLKFLKHYDFSTKLMTSESCGTMTDIRSSQALLKGTLKGDL